MAELAAVGSIASVVSAVLEVGKCLAAPIGQFKYLYNYNTNLKNLETDVMKLKKTRDEVQGRVDAAEINGEEIRHSVKEWQTKVDNTINEAERLIEEKEENRRCFKGLRPNCISSYKHSKKAFKLKWDDIGPLLQQEFDEVSFSGIQQCNYETNFVKIRDDVLKLKNARLKVQRKVEEAEIKGEEIEADVKKWLQDVDSIIAKAEELIENQSSIGTDHKIRYQNSKAASDLMVADIGPLLLQEERFDYVSYSTTLLSNYETNFDKLRDDVLKLKNARLKVQRKVEEAKNNVEEIEEDVKKWLEDVDSIIVKAQELIENQSSIGTDRKTRYQNSKAASELTVDHIGPLLQQEKSFEKVSHPSIHKEIWLRSNEDYLAFESRDSTVKDVWDALKDENIYMIGVYGMGGLGKTTLVQEVGRQAEKDKLFEEIVFVEVTVTLDVKKVQTEIADKLRLTFNYESEKASKLCERLKRGKILLILDNIWEDFDLKAMGIPSKMDRGGCKLLLTTRNLDVLQKMDSTNNFGMGILNDEEAWNLFQKMAGNVIQTHELNSLPNNVCKECGGLPIVICTIAKALRYRRHKFQWEDALRELRMPSPTKFTRLLEKEYSKIKLSYDYLEDDEHKKTFIISSLMENDTSISDLFKNIIGFGILQGANLTIEQARNRLDLVVNELKDSCLLLDGSIKGRFSMHDVIRTVAITCGYTDYHVFTNKNDIESEWKDKDKLKQCTIISLVGNKIITRLWPEGLDCPELEFFYMRSRGSSFEIPEEFFRAMPKLKVLDLFKLQQSLLPLSLDVLTNLQTLWLDNSKIEDVAIIGKLNKLKVLSMKNSNIMKLPTEIGQLTQLRILDLSNCQRLTVIAPNVISKLSQLEELYLKGCGIQWNVEVLEELKGLSRLSGLEIDIKDNKMLPKDFFFKELKRYRMSIGVWTDIPWRRHYSYYRPKYKSPKILEFECDSTISLEELQIVKNVEFLRLAKVSNDDNNLTTFFNEKVIFSNLMGLELQDICSRNIWDNQLPAAVSSSYQNLTQLTLDRCRNIKYAFPSFIAISLMQLQYLEITNCEVLEEIVAKEEGANAIVKFVFPHVTSLRLENLPELTTFYPEIHTSEWPKLKKLLVRNCDKFTSKHMSFQENSEEGEHISKPKSILLDDKIKLDQVGNDQYKEIKCLPDLPSLEILDVYHCSKLMTLVSFSTSFLNLKILDVTRCSVLKLITPSMARSLVQLRDMRISYCKMLIEIVGNEGDATSYTEIVLDKLVCLSLVGLKSLICFCSGNYSLSFPSLKRLDIRKCSSMKTFSKGILSTPKLQEVFCEGETKDLESGGSELNKIIQGADRKQDISLDLKYKAFQDDNSIEICYNKHPTSFYQNLTQLFLWNCGNIKYAFPSSVAKSLYQLQQLKIQNCKVLEEIVAKEGANEDANFVFPHVTFLKLQNLPEFRAFYHTFEWPMLKKLVVTDCDKFMTSKYLSFQENNEEGGLHFSEPKSLFLNDKINRDLEELKLENKLRHIRWESLSKYLKIAHDKSAKIPLGLLQRFENLKELELYGNNQYKEIKCLLDLPNLEVLEVIECNKLMTLEPSSTSFQNLKVLKVSDCIGLVMKLITPSMAISLVQLREMSIKDCIAITEIVENEGDATISAEIVFNNLKKLSLEDLRSLTCFCSENYSFNFPSLEDLIIRECPNMKTFSQGILTTPKLPKVKYDKEEKDLENGGSELNTTIQQAHKKKADSKLKELRLTLSGRDIMPIWEGEFQESFGEVKTLELIKDEYPNIPIQILHKFNSLEELILKMSSYQEIFSSREDEAHDGALTNLKVLKLLGLFNLKCISKQDSRLNSILQNLDHLVVMHCHNLTTLLPPLLSFENLRILGLAYCKGMQNLMSSSTAQSLVQLEELSIMYCEMMTEVLANEGNIKKGEIVFEKLEKLTLYDLESLTCFCSENYTLKFPFLEELNVYECSKMKTFFGGGLSMPKLQKLNDKDCSKCDIDTIIQQLQNDCSELWERFPFEEDQESWESLPFEEDQEY